jgi:hypothetical protein
MRAVLDDVLMRPKVKHEKKYLSEKSPQNVFDFNEMAELYEGARFIFVVRDPRAVVASLEKVISKMTPEVRKTSRFGKGFDINSKQIRAYMKAGYDFYKKEPARCIMLTYEELVKSPESEIKRLCDFLKIAFEPAMLDTSKENVTSSLVAGADEWYSKEKFDRKVDLNSLEKWKNELSANQLHTLNKYFYKDPVCNEVGYSFEKVEPVQVGLLTRIKNKLSNSVGKR